MEFKNKKIRKRILIPAVILILTALIAVLTGAILFIDRQTPKARPVLKDIPISAPAPANGEPNESGETEPVALTASPVNIGAKVGTKLTPEDFYRDLPDSVNVKSKFTAAPDTSQAGIYDVVVNLTDENKNSLQIEAVCEIFSINDEIVFEQGDDSFKSLAISDFTSYSNAEDCDFTQPPPENFYNQPGEHQVKFTINGTEYKSKITVTKNSPPAAYAKNVQILFGNSAASDSFFYLDENHKEEVTSGFVTTPDWGYIGNQTVTVRVTDKFENFIDISANLNIFQDTTPPVIEGARDFSVIIGNTVSYRHGITVKDDYDPNPELHIDTSQVNLQVLGIYPVTYTATDKSGNSSSVTVNLHIIEVSIDLLNQTADKKLQELGVFNVEDTTERLKIIHDYVKKNVRYVRNTVYSGSDLLITYNALMTMRGDCAATVKVSRILLERAGIENMEIGNVQDTHCWNLIKIGGFWYHYDATEYYDGANDTFWFTETRAKQLSNTQARWQRYVYDISIYPEIQQ